MVCRLGRNDRGVALFDQGRLRPKVVFLPQCAHLAIIPLPYQEIRLYDWASSRSYKDARKLAVECYHKTWLLSSGKQAYFQRIFRSRITMTGESNPIGSISVSQ